MTGAEAVSEPGRGVVLDRWSRRVASRAARTPPSAAPADTGAVRADSVRADSVRADSVRVDEELLARVADGAADALAELYRRHASGLFGFLVRLCGDRGTAEEVLQDTLLAVWRSAAGYQRRAAPRTWLYGVARRQAHNRLRTARPDQVSWDGVPDPPATAAGPEETALARAEAAEVSRALATLPLPQREILVLTFLDDLTQSEVAAVLGIPVGTVKSRLHHARRSLARALSPGKEAQP
jgi:RNA polymerase sigma-70 factor (ECF subfamily)